MKGEGRSFWQSASLEDLALDRLVIIYPGERRFNLAENVEVVPATDLADNDNSLFAEKV